jgi:hypothetical protein
MPTANIIIGIRRVGKELNLFQLNLTGLFLHDSLRQEHLFFLKYSQGAKINLGLFDHLAY